MVIISSMIIPSAFAQESEDSQVFIAGFNAYQQKNYSASIDKMNEVLQKYPDTPLRDMALFWLSRSYYKAGNQQEAARYLSQFSKEYPDNPLKSTVEDELLALATRYENGEKLPSTVQPVKQSDRSNAQQKAKAEQERLAKLEQEKVAAAEAAKLAEAKAATEKAEQLRIAAAKAEQEKLAAAKAEEARLSAIAAAEAAQLAAAKQAEEKAAAEKAEQLKVAAAKAEQARLDAAKAESARLAAVAAAESARLAALKQSEEKAAKEKIEQERIAAAQSEEALKALALTKAAEDKAATEKAEQLKAAAVKAEYERLVAAAAAETAQLAAAKQAEDKAAAEKSEQLRVAAAKSEQTKQAAKAEEARLAAVAAQLAVAKQAEDKAAVEKAEQLKIAAAKAEESRLAAVAAAAETIRLAALKAEEERAAKENQQRKEATLRAEAAQAAELKIAEDKVAADKRQYREKAIVQYKSVIDKFPSSAAALTAAAKLRELGIVVALPQTPVEEKLPENAQVLKLEVAQFAGFEFNLLTRPDAFTVGKTVSIPFEVVNRGNGDDSFTLESSFPSQFKTRFASAATPGVVITSTPVLTPGETFKGTVDLIIPPSSIDGMRITHPVKAVSRLMADASQSREVKLIASAPLLRAVLRSDKTKPLPGEKVTYRIAILNVGSTAAQDVTFRLNFPPQLEALDFAAAGFRQELNSNLVFDGLQVNSGESREFTVAFQLKEDSLAGQELSTRAELVNNPLNVTTAFVSNVVTVEPVRNIAVRTGSERIVAIPGQTISVPFVVTNKGNVREKFTIASVIAGAKDAVIFHDMNRDGIRQASEPVITEIGPLAPREEASVVVEIKTPLSAEDGSQGSVKITFASEGDSIHSASGTTQLSYSRPVLKLLMAAAKDGRLKPGDVASFDLTITNNGSNLARIVELQSTWPEQLELVAADPAVTSSANGKITWRFKEVGAAEKRAIKVSFRVKPGTGVGTAIQVKNILTYEDQLGNRY